MYSQFLHGSLGKYAMQCLRGPAVRRHDATCARDVGRAQRGTLNFTKAFLNEMLVSQAVVLLMPTGCMIFV